MAKTSNIAYGSTGEDVKALQQNLIDLGYDLGKGGADGIFGNDTRAAVQKYQTDTGLAVDGIVGVNTSAALQNSLTAKQAATAGTAAGAPASTTPVTTAPATTAPATTAPATTAPATTTTKAPTETATQTQSGATAPGIDNTVKNADISSLVKYLNDWLESAKTQQNLAIDYATGTAINDLTRAEEDAAATFQEQRNQIAVDEAKSKDNQALYAERRGDRGGVGAAQYDSIMNAAAKNRLAVNSAQTKLATDTSRQIADLRAQGEYEKADALLNLTQQYLSQIVSLEQWSREFGMSEAEFRVNLEKWKAGFEAELAGITGYYKGQQTLEYQQQFASNGWTILQAGVMPSDTQLKAMDLTREEAEAYRAAREAELSVANTVPNYVNTMLGFGDDGMAMSYLVSLGLTDSARNQLWEMYKSQQNMGSGYDYAADLYAADVKTYYDAVALLTQKGFTRQELDGILTEDKWGRLKSENSSAPEIASFQSYPDYLNAYIQYLMED